MSKSNKDREDVIKTRNMFVNEEDAKAALILAKKAITKKYGNIISTLSDHGDLHIPTISTGCLSLDCALGNGGMGIGRIYEIYGPNSGGKSTLATNIIIQAQRRGFMCCYIDAEQAVDPKLFKDYGVDTDSLELVQGCDGEENLDSLEKLIKTGAFRVAVIDSVSALVPRVEAEADLDKDSMALQARLMSKALRKITPIANQTNTLLIFINQLRMKIGGYGCFHYDTLVNFSDGRSIPIGKVVDEKIKGNVWCLNEITGNVDNKPIKEWHDNGAINTKEDFIHIQTTSIDGGGRFGFTCTPNHKILTDSGWLESKYISFNTKLVSKYTETINGTYGDFLRGCLIGDSYIYIRNENTGSLRFQDNENEEYINWKIKKLSLFIKLSRVDSGRSNSFRYQSDFTYELSKVKKDLNNRDPMYLLNNYTDLGFAIWIMDDGNYDSNDGHNRYSLSVKRYKNNNDKLNIIVNKLQDLDFDCKYDLKSGTIYFKTSATDMIANSICKYIPDSMQYKLPEQYKNKYEEFELNNFEKIVIDYVNVKEIRIASDRQMRNKRKFDISIENNHNYMVGGLHNGVIVHNSPETTSGGEALAFYATGRISVRGPESKARRLIDEASGEVYGHRAEFEVIKNKLSAPFRKANVNLIYGKGYDFHWEILDMAVSLGIIEKSGAWFKYEGENIAQGESRAIEFMKAPKNADIFDKIKDQVIDQTGLRQAYELHISPGFLSS